MRWAWVEQRRRGRERGPSCRACSLLGSLRPTPCSCFDPASALTCHAVAEALAAEPRDAAGSIPSGKLRQAGRTPGVLFSLPGQAADASQLLSFDSQTISKAVQRLGRTGWAVSLFDLEIAGGQTVRALGRQVHMRADTDEIENVSLGSWEAGTSYDSTQQIPWNAACSLGMITAGGKRRLVGAAVHVSSCSMCNQSVVQQQL